MPKLSLLQAHLYLKVANLTSLQASAGLLNEELRLCPILREEQEERMACGVGQIFIKFFGILVHKQVYVPSLIPQKRELHVHLLDEEVQIYSILLRGKGKGWDVDKSILH